MDGQVKMPIHLTRNRDYLVCLDSDGTVFDTMNLKMQACFYPALIDIWELQSVSQYARETWEYVSLRSKFRGANRFQALVKFMELLEARAEVADHGLSLPQMAPLRQWLERDTPHSETALAEYAAAHPKEECLQNALSWSQECSKYVAYIVRNAAPFPGVQETLGLLAEKADVVVVSVAPTATLMREWQECGLDRYVKAFYGQEVESKQRGISLALEHGYRKDCALMVGDAPGDRLAAQACGVLFNPIEPLAEDMSWEKLRTEGTVRFWSGRFQGPYEDGLYAAFARRLEDIPPWNTKKGDRNRAN